MPRTPEQRKRRAKKRRAQRARGAEGLEPRMESALQEPPAAAAAAEEPPHEYTMTEVVNAIGQLAAAVQQLGEHVTGAVAELNQRVATIEEARAQGLDTLATQSGLGMLGLSGQIAGEQAQLIQSSSYQALRETERQILAEEGYNLPDPNDGHTVLVGATSEELVRSRREALQKAINEQHGGFLR